MAAAARKYPPSESGFWQVKLSGVFEHDNFLFKPRHTDILVDEALLKLMLASGKVLQVHAADPAKVLHVNAASA